MEAFLPQKPLADNYLESKYYNSVRNIVATIAEIQETFGYINQQKIELDLKIGRAVEHWLEKLQTLANNLTPVIQDTKQQSLIEMQLKFLAILHRLEISYKYYSSLVHQSQEDISKID